MRRTAAIALILLLAGGTAAAEDDAPMADPVPEATRLKEEAKTFFNEAGNADNSPSERKEARKEAYTRLVKARAMLDEWLEIHPDDAERLDDLYVDIASMMYWIHKEATLGELEPYHSPGTEPEPEPEPKPETPAKPPEGTAPPPAPKGPTPAEVLGKIRDYENRFPGDVPGLHARYRKFLAEFPDPSTPEYEAAAERLAELDRQLKDVYRFARDDDPDALEGVDDDEIVRLVRQLSADLEDDSEPVRARAARFLGALGSGEAAGPLLEALKREFDEAGPAFDAVIRALARIGGRRVTAKLTRIRSSSSLAPVVTEVLIRTVARGGVNARIAGAALAEYVTDQPTEFQHRAVEALYQAGKPGALGLAMAVDLAPVEKKVEYIEHLGEMGDPRAAGPLAHFLEVNPLGARKYQHRAARQAILALGKPAVRYLIPVLDEEKYQIWTAEMLRLITDEKLRDDKRRTWEKWYRKHRRELE